jgi:hypothetical protein
MKELICKQCGGIRDKGRTMCHECYSVYKRQMERDRHAKYGRHYYGISKCIKCGTEIKMWRKTQLFCFECSKTLGYSNYKDNNYQYTHYAWEHRELAETLLGRKLTYNEVLHHMDEDTLNNSVNNLIVISRTNHGKLHSYLRIQRALLEQSCNGNLENCWNNLRVPMTTAWLETTNAKVIKLWEIGQSASEPLTSLEYEECSETMHQASQVDEDIVQTTTI